MAPTLRIWTKISKVHLYIYLSVHGKSIVRVGQSFSRGHNKVGFVMNAYRNRHQFVLFFPFNPVPTYIRKAFFVLYIYIYLYINIYIYIWLRLGGAFRFDLIDCLVNMLESKGHVASVTLPSYYFNDVSYLSVKTKTRQKIVRTSTCIYIVFIFIYYISIYLYIAPTQCRIYHYIYISMMCIEKDRRPSSSKTYGWRQGIPWCMDTTWARVSMSTWSTSDIYIYIYIFIKPGDQR